MTGIVAQCIALAAYGNSCLHKDNIDEDLFRRNSVFKFCNAVEWFEQRRRFPFLKASPQQVAGDPILWFDYLKSKGCKQIGLYKAAATRNLIGEEHQHAAFVGGEHWYLVTRLGKYAEYWNNTWTVTQKDHPENKIWSVKYLMTRRRLPHQFITWDCEKIKFELSAILAEIADFAYAHHLSDFGADFDKARLTLASPTPRTDFYHSDLIPIGESSLLVEQLLFSAAKADVFGGMGSWNDIGFDKQEDTIQYNHLSSLLYQKVNEAIMAAVNTSL